MTAETPAAGMTRLPAAGPTWREAAICAQTDPELWFPEVGHSSAPAKRICLSCESRVVCLEWAIEHGEHGIWGGTSDNQRRAIRRARDPKPATGRPSGKPEAGCGTDAAYQRHRRRGEDIDEACHAAHQARNAADAARKRELRAERRQSAA